MQLMAKRFSCTISCRLFNAMHFPLAEVLPRDVKEHLQLAAKWVERPFAETSGGMARRREDLFGFDSCASRPQAAEHWNAIWTWVEEVLIPELQGADAVDASPPWKRQRTTEPLPEWATFERSVEHWYGFLVNQGCDEHSIMDVFCLAQHSERGHELANACVGKMLKKAQDKIQVTNPSAFLHSCVKHARTSQLYGT